MIRVKRVYDPPEEEDGLRYLVDRLWPRGVRKDSLALEGWAKEVAPSNELRKWFGHDPGKWKVFQRRYTAELNHKPEAWRTLLSSAKEDTVTLLFSAHDTEHNNAVVLKAYLEKQRSKEIAPALHKVTHQ